MLKIRLQGTKSEISWFKRFLKKADEVDVSEFSQPYKNQGTDRYYSVYAEVEKVGLLWVPVNLISIVWLKFIIKAVIAPLIGMAEILMSIVVTIKVFD